MIIDFHNHFYPPAYIDAIKKNSSFYKVTYDEDENPVIHSPGDYNIVVPGHRLVEVRSKVLKDAEVDMQVLSFTTPGTIVEPAERSVELARMVNDTFGEIIKTNADQFTALATLPLNAPEACAGEMERAINEVGLKGVMLYSNANGVALADKRFWPMYEKANEMEAVLYIHPTYPVGVEAMEDYMLMPLIGFCFDTTLAAAKLVFEGIPRRCPKIKWVLGHLGGAIPYLAERLDRGYEAFPECRVNIDQKPSEYLKKFYFDTVNFDLNALNLAVEFAGVDQILAGSDYPHQIGSLKKMKESLKNLNISKSEREMIQSENTKKLLGL
jgi:aminocarboxymuconate-semialdehyde decarboxylase